MAKLNMNAITKNLKATAIGGAAVYGGVKLFQIVNYQLAGLLPASFTSVAANGPMEKAIAGLGAIVALDAFTPQRYKKYSFLAGCGIGAEVIEATLGPTIDASLSTNNLIEPSDASRSALAAILTVPSQASGATSGYAMGRRGNRRMQGYATMRGMDRLFPANSAFGL